MRQELRRRGIALVVVVLVTAVVVISVLATTSVVALGLRRGTADEARSYQALLIAESAMNLVRATINDADLPAAEFTTGSGTGFNELLTEAGTTAAAGSGGSVTWSFTPPPSGTGVLSLEAIGTRGGAMARVLHDFNVKVVQDVMSLNAPAALTSIPRIEVSGDATVSGLGSDEANWIRSLGTVPAGGWTVGSTGSTSTVTTTATIAGAVRSGEYIRTGGETFRIDWAPSDGDGAYGVDELRLTRVTPDQATGTSVTAGTPLEHVPFAITAEATGTTRLSVTYPGFYRVGDDIVIQTLGLNGVSTDETVRVANIVGDQLELVTAPSNQVLEGTTIRRAVLGAVTNSTVTENGGGTVDGGVLQNGEHLIREELFADTFGATIEVVEQISRDAGTYHTSWDTVPSSGNDRIVSGITFVDYSASQNISFCGSGVLIVRGNLQTNNAGCPFTGLIYVTGDWDEKGNRDLTGAVVVEGLVTCSGETCATTVAGTGAGNEDKLRYDPFALYSVALDQFPSSLQIETSAGTWRQR